MQAHPGHSISSAQVQACICPCIKPDVIKECACPTCTDFSEALSSLHRALATNRRECKLNGERACESEAWVLATKSSGDFGTFTSCADEPLHGMERKGSEAPFMSRPLRCVISEKLDEVNPCSSCGIGIGKKIQRPGCSCFSESKLEKSVVWRKRQENVEGKGMDQVRMRLKSYRGTVEELLKWVEHNYKEVLNHKWRVKYLRHQFHLNCDFFESGSVVVLADFASAMVCIPEHTPVDIA